MKKITAGLLTLALSTQIAFPAFASETQKQQLALANLSESSKQELLNASTRLEKHLSALSDDKQHAFYTRILKFIDRAETKLARLSDTQIEQRFQSFSQTTSGTAATEIAPTEENLDATSLAETLNQSANLPASENTDDTSTVDQALQSVAGTTSREKATSMFENLRVQLAEKVAAHPRLNRNLAHHSSLHLIILIALPLALFITIGVLLTYILLPVIIGAVTCVVVLQFGVNVRIW